jgi:hypothetical protein
LADLVEQQAQRELPLVPSVPHGDA